MKFREVLLQENSSVKVKEGRKEVKSFGSPLLATMENNGRKCRSSFESVYKRA